MISETHENIRITVILFSYHTILPDLKKQNKYISFFFAAVIAFGVTISSIHVHIDSFHDVETEHVLVEKELSCVICGSAFKFNYAGHTLVTHQVINEALFLDIDFEHTLTPKGILKDGRAPPFSG